MSYSTYFVIRQILMALLLFMGGHMLFVKLTWQVRNSFYQKSLRVMGGAFLIVPLSCYVYTQQDRLDLEPYISTAISLTAYFATFVMMSIAFLILLGKKFNSAIIYAVIAILILYPIPLWLSITFGGEELISTVTSASYSYFIIMVILLIACILYRHNRVVKNIENYYSDDTMMCVTWISKSIKLLIGLAITCIFAPIFFTYPRWLRFLFMIYGVLCYFHIYYGYRKMLIDLTRYFIIQDQKIVSFVCDKQNNDNDTILSVEVTRNIQNHLTTWMQQKGYQKRGITINDVAKEINTNRTYLSKYINTAYHCPFRTWITKLRVEEAKRLLAMKPELPINSIANTIEFASVESFTHIFTRSEGLPPSKWRDKYIEPYV